MMGAFVEFGPLACSPLHPGVPYDLSPTFLNDLFTKHKIDYIVHGDDPCLLPDGTDAYAHAKKMGRFRMVSQLQLRSLICFPGSAWSQHSPLPATPVVHMTGMPMLSAQCHMHAAAITVQSQHQRLTTPVA
jgi:hypothetical protein